LADGTIENMFWEMGIEDDKGVYEIYQARKHMGSELTIQKTDEVKEKGIQQGSALDALVTMEHLPWDAIFAVLPKGDKYGARVNHIYDRGEKIALNVKKVNNEILQLDQITYEVAFTVLYKKNCESNMQEKQKVLC
jgi:hypothetical protein